MLVHESIKTDTIATDQSLYWGKLGQKLELVDTNSSKNNEKQTRQLDDQQTDQKYMDDANNCLLKTILYSINYKNTLYRKWRLYTAT